MTEKSSQKFKLYKQIDVNRFESLPPRGVGVLLYAITGTLVATKGAGQWGPKKMSEEEGKTEIYSLDGGGATRTICTDLPLSLASSESQFHNHLH